MKYICKENEINAAVFDGTEDGMWNLADEIGLYQDAITFMEEGVMVCNTLKEPLFAYKGDIIIKTLTGEFHPCKPDIFERTYSEV